MTEKRVISMGGSSPSSARMAARQRFMPEIEAFSFTEIKEALVELGLVKSVRVGTSTEDLRKFTAAYPREVHEFVMSKRAEKEKED